MEGSRKGHHLSQNPHEGWKVGLLPSKENHNDADPLASFPVTCLSFPSLLPSPDLVPKGGSPNVPTPAWLLLPGLGKRSENVSDSSKQVLHGKSSLPIISQTCYSPVFFHLDPKPGPWEAL